MRFQTTIHSLAATLRTHPTDRPACYIAGPMRGKPNFNFAAFAEATGMLCEDFQVQSPHLNDLERGLTPHPEGDPEAALPLREYMKVDLPQVLRSAVVFVLPGWEDSKGASLEAHVAKECDIPVYYLHENGNCTLVGAGPSLDWELLGDEVHYMTQQQFREAQRAKIRTWPKVWSTASVVDPKQDREVWMYENWQPVASEEKQDPPTISFEDDSLVTWGGENYDDDLGSQHVPRPDRHPNSARFHELLEQMGDLHDRKQADYGKGDDPFANVRGSEDFGVDPWIGAMVRLNDKIRRLQSLIANGALKNESAYDSFRDIAVYAIIALVLFEEQYGREGA